MRRGTNLQVEANCSRADADLGVRRDIPEHPHISRPDPRINISKQKTMTWQKTNGQSRVVYPSKTILQDEKNEGKRKKKTPNKRTKHSCPSIIHEELGQCGTLTPGTYSRPWHTATFPRYQPSRLPFKNPTQCECELITTCYIALFWNNNKKKTIHIQHRVLYFSDTFYLQRDKLRVLTINKSSKKFIQQMSTRREIIPGHLRYAQWRNN